MLRADDLRLMAQLMEEAARNLSAVMETDIAEREQFRHFLPDELEGSAGMLREHADAFGVPEAPAGQRLHWEGWNSNPPGPRTSTVIAEGNVGVKGRAPGDPCTFPNCKGGQCCMNPSNARPIGVDSVDGRKG